MQSEIYKCKSAEGNITFKDTPCPKSDTNASKSIHQFSFENLQGSWQIVSPLSGRNENEYWEFDGDEFFERFGDRRLAPEYYTVRGDTIDFLHFKIVVKEFDGKRMIASFGGENYTLRRYGMKANIQKKSPRFDRGEGDAAAKALHEAILGSDVDKVNLNCGRAIANGKEALVSMKSISRKNYLDGYMTKNDYDRGVIEIARIKRSMTISRCNSAKGNDRKFFKCLSSDNNHISTCGQRFGFNG